MRLLPSVITAIVIWVGWAFFNDGGWRRAFSLEGLRTYGIILVIVWGIALLGEAGLLGHGDPDCEWDGRTGMCS
jgi:hypothetical protein